MDFSGKVVVITGGTRGIGKSLVEAFASNGAKVIFTYGKSDELAAKLKEEVIRKKGNADCYKVDVRNLMRSKNGGIKS